MQSCRHARLQSPEGSRAAGLQGRRPGLASPPAQAAEAPPNSRAAAPLWPPQADSVLTELKGLWRALVAGVRAGELQSHDVLHRTDSISTYALVARGGTCRSGRLHALVRLIWCWCMLHDVRLRSQFVGADVIISTGVDALSRTADKHDCRLKGHLFDRIWQTFGPLDFDRFASYATAQCSPATGQRLPYNSLFIDEACAGVDALTVDWAGHRNYAFPPVALIPDTLRLVTTSRSVCVLVAPVWPSQHWWPVLLSLERGRLTLGSVHEICTPGPAGHSTPLPGWKDSADTVFAAFFLDGSLASS